MTTCYKRDGHYYAKESDIPDLGSWVADERSTTQCFRDYNGLSKDVSKLPKYDDLESGSSAFCIDTGDVYIYEKSTKNWVKQ